jgi:hypothetical protein
VGSLAVADLRPDLQPAFFRIAGQLEGGMLDADGVEEVAPGLEPGSSVALLVIENTWAIPFITAVRNAGGELVDQARVPSDIVAAVREDAAPQLGNESRRGPAGARPDRHARLQAAQSVGDGQAPASS